MSILHAFGSIQVRDEQRAVFGRVIEQKRRVWSYLIDSCGCGRGRCAQRRVGRGVQGLKRVEIVIEVDQVFDVALVVYDQVAYLQANNHVLFTRVKY